MSECIVFRDTGDPQKASFQVNSTILNSQQEWDAIGLKLNEALAIKLNKTELEVESTNDVTDTWYEIELSDVVEQSIAFQVLNGNSTLCEKDIKTDYDDSDCDSKINSIYEQVLQGDDLVSGEAEKELIEKLKELQNEDDLNVRYTRYYRWRTNSTCYRTQRGEWNLWPSDSQFTELSYDDVFVKSKMSEDDDVKICVESTAHYEFKFVEAITGCSSVSSTVFFANVKKPDDSNTLIFLCFLLLLFVVGAFLYWRIKNEKADIADVLRRIFYKWSSQDPMPKLVLIDDENVEKKDLIGEGNFGYVYKER